MLMLTFHGVLEEFVIEVWMDAIRVDHVTEDVGEVSSDRHLKFKKLGGTGRTHHLKVKELGGAGRTHHLKVKELGGTGRAHHLKVKELGGTGRIHHQLLNARTLSCPRWSISDIITQHQWRV